METVYVNNGIKCLNKDARAKRKAFVQVTIEVDVEGNIYPQTIRWQDGKVAEECHVTVDALLNFNFSEVSKTEKVLYSFLAKITDDTLKDTLTWKVEQVDKYFTLSIHISEDPKDTHVLLSSGEPHVGDTDYPEYCDLEYSSLFPEHKEMTITSQVFSTHIDNGNFLYIVPVGYSIFGTEDILGYDIYIANRQTLHPVFAVDGNKINADMLEHEKLLFTLLSEITRSMKRIHLDGFATSVINSYLNPDDALPF